MDSSRHGVAAGLCSVVVLGLVAGAGCQASYVAGEPAGADPLAPFAELFESGTTMYFDAFEPAEAIDEGEGVTTYVFDPEDGPKCLRGGVYQMAVRDVGSGSEDLMIYLPGGGACWPGNCLAIETSRPGVPSSLDITDPTNPANPTADWNVAFLPYCDGSLFVGDADRDDDGDGEVDRYHRGLMNLSAGLDVVVDRFPAPARVLLAGSSGGGYGSILATFLVRARYPNVPLYVFNDSGVGIGKSEDPGFVSMLIAEFGAERFVPPSCTDCFTAGHVTPLVEWTLERDPNLRMSVYSSKRDEVISEWFLEINPSIFEHDLLDETGRLAARFPDRYKRFIVDGNAHTVLLNNAAGLIGEAFERVDVSGLITLGNMKDTAIGSVTLGAWFHAMLSGSELWSDLVQR